MGIDSPRRDDPDFSAMLMHLTSSSQQHDQQVNTQGIVQRTVASMEAEVNLQAQQHLNFIEVEATYFDARWSALNQEAQSEFAASRSDKNPAT
eukprot:3666859-Amphidinium_carterae.1